MDHITCLPCGSYNFSKNKDDDNLNSTMNGFIQIIQLIFVFSFQICPVWSGIGFREE